MLKRWKIFSVNFKKTLKYLFSEEGFKGNIGMNGEILIHLKIFKY